MESRGGGGLGLMGVWEKWGWWGSRGGWGQEGGGSLELVGV